MPRVPKLVATRPLRKSVSMAAAVRPIAVAARAATDPAGRPVLARVRDSLVLRLVKPGKAPGKNLCDEHSSR